MEIDERRFGEEKIKEKSKKIKVLEKKKIKEKSKKIKVSEKKKIKIKG